MVYDIQHIGAVGITHPRSKSGQKLQHLALRNAVADRRLLANSNHFSTQNGI